MEENWDFWLKVWKFWITKILAITSFDVFSLKELTLAMYLESLIFKTNKSRKKFELNLLLNELCFPVLCIHDTGNSIILILYLLRSNNIVSTS